MTKKITWADLDKPPPDLFILSSWMVPAYMSLARDAKKRRGTTTVLNIDNFFHWRPKQLAGMLWFRIVLKRLYDAAFVPGKRGRRFLRLLGMPDNRIFEGVYTADGNIFYPPKKPGAERSGIVFAGQFIKRKGIPAIIGAWRIFGKNKRDIPLELIGAGPLQNEILNAGLPAEPFKLAPELANEYRNASAFLLPSTLDHWGVVVHEAALSGCLLLVTRQCAATDDLLEHGVNGFLMKKSAASEIIKAVDWLQSLTPEQIETGRRRSLELAAKFSPTRWAETTRKLLMLTR